MTDPKPTTRRRPKTPTSPAGDGDLSQLFADFEAALAEALPEGLGRDKALRKVGSVRRAAAMAMAQAPLG